MLVHEFITVHPSAKKLQGSRSEVAFVGLQSSLGCLNLLFLAVSIAAHTKPSRIVTQYASPVASSRRCLAVATSLLKSCSNFAYRALRVALLSSHLSRVRSRPPTHQRSISTRSNTRWRLFHC